MSNNKVLKESKTSEKQEKICRCKFCPVHGKSENTAWAIAQEYKKGRIE